MSEAPLTPGQRLSGALQHVYPKRWLSALMFRATRVRFAPYKNWQIRWFIRRYGVNMGQALESDPLAYPEFNTFFTRPLRADARPLPVEPDAVCSPADGRILELGAVQAGKMLQVKGRELQVAAVLGGATALATPFERGRFLTVYLSPRDYHRVHMPIDGTLRAMAYVPGQLYSVNATCARTIPELFTRNERVVAFFDTACGPMALVLVGAVFVGCIETLWAGAVAGPRHRVSWWHYDDGPPLQLRRGQEMGRFNMGSTVITLFGGDTVRWAGTLHAGQLVQVGAVVGQGTSGDAAS